MKNNKLIKILMICIIILAVALGCCLVMVLQKANAKEKAEKDIDREISIDATAEVTDTPTLETAQELIQAEPMFEPVEDSIYTIADQVNLREEPSTDSEIVATVPMSMFLDRIGVSVDWSKLLYGDEECYVYNDLISETSPAGMDTGDVIDPEISDIPSTATIGGSKRKTVIIDPGHQRSGDSTQEPIGPGASQTKARVASGTSGCVSGWAEYELNLQVSLQLRDELIKRGYTVYMTRETHDINISNKERAEFAEQHNGDILVRIHANGADSSSVSGALCMAPSNSNPFLAEGLISESQKLSQCIIDSYVTVTGFNNQGVYQTDEMSGINWSTMPVTIVEMGYMTNPADDANMADSVVEAKMVQGISDGIDSYFN